MQLDPYTITEDVADHFAEENNAHQQTTEVAVALSQTPDEKLTSFALRLALTGYVTIPGENESDSTRSGGVPCGAVSLSEASLKNLLYKVPVAAICFDARAKAEQLRKPPSSGALETSCASRIADNTASCEPSP